MTLKTMEPVSHPTPLEPSHDFDYSFVETVGRIALYDDLRSAPRVIEIQPADTAAYIEALSSHVYEQARSAGGAIPYTVIREVSENFIHAQFKEVVVSVFDGGNTIRFADHGPGIPSKEKAQMPGFSSAVEPMKNYIRGVGSGLPIVREYLESSHGTITIEDNLGTGAVVTISLAHNTAEDFDEIVSDPYLSVPTSSIGAASLPAEAPARAGAMATGAGGASVPGATAMPSGAAGAMPVPTMAPTPSSSPAAAPAGGYPVAPAYPAATPYPTSTPEATWGGYGYAPAPSPVPYPAGQPYGAALYPQAGQAYPPYGGGPSPIPSGYPAAIPQPPLNERERSFLSMLLSEGPLGITEMSGLTDTPPSSTHSVFTKLEEAGLVQKVGKSRSLTPYGQQIASLL